MAWTYSQLEAFETCPRQYYEVRVKKSIPYVQNESAKWGDTVHKAIEHRIMNATPLPEGMHQWEGIVNKFAALPGKKIAEQKIAITSDFQPCDYFAKNAWSRGNIDLSVVCGKTAMVTDWKTGKRKLTDQTYLYAGYVLIHNPAVEKVHTSFVWLKERKVDTETVTREDMPHHWQKLLARYRRIEIAHEKNQWPATPSGLCKSYCPVTSCEFCGRGG
ncbi:PD-(D/E)XK nuclease family protein [Undibacterium sp. Ji42W]|uniref:PD-(D/E)XK nuclease family protein n=1 Tax=Undibacterium sp. Ji42W TaxID=3413039 RepID=UPI003BF19486